MAESTFGTPYALPSGFSAFPTFSLSDEALQPPPQPNFITSALSSGFHEALGGIGGAAEAVGTQFGSGGLTDWGKTLAESQRRQAAAAGRPDLEGPDLWTPKGVAYQVLKGLPSLGGAVVSGLGGGLAATAAAGPEAAPVGFGAGVGAFMFPQAVGGNVEAAKAASGGKPLTPGEAAKSLALGVPEAAAMSFMPARVGGLFENFAGNAATRALKGAATLGTYQAGLSAAQTAITQQAFTPDMPIADRARQIVDSALSGGVQGGVFGGVSSALRRAPASIVDQDPSKVSTEDLNKTTAQALEPQKLIPPSQRLSPLPAEAVRYSDTTNDQLLAMAQPLADLGDRRSAAQNVQHGLLQEEIARRTPPGMPVGQGQLMTPEEIAARAPAVASTKDLALRAAGGGEDNIFFQNFNAASESELVNAIRSRVEGKNPKEVPEWMQALAGKYGVPVGPKGLTPAEQLVTLSEQEQKALVARDAAVAAGKVPAIRAANAMIIDLNPKIMEARRLVELHAEADKLLPQPEEPLAPPDAQPKLPRALVDTTGQLNLPGFGKRPVEAPTEIPAETAGGGPVPGQRELFTSEQQVARQQAVQQFQDRVLGEMGGAPRVRSQVEPLLRSMDVTSEPELIGELRRRLEDADANNKGRLSAGLKALTNAYGLTDETGGSVDLANAKSTAQVRYDDLLDRASKTKGDGQKAALIAQAVKLRADEIDTNNQLLDWHRQADELGTATPMRSIPDRVPEGMAKTWNLLQTIKETEGAPVGAVKAADNAQKAIEMRVPEARLIAEGAQQTFLRAMRDKVVTKREGSSAVQEPGAGGVDVREHAEDGGAVGKGDAQGNAPSKESIGKAVKQAVEAAPIEKPQGPVVVKLPSRKVVAQPIESPTEIQAEAETHWQTAERVANELGSNLPPEGQPRVLPATAEGFNTAGLRNPPLPAPKPFADARAKLQAMWDGWKLRPKDSRTATQSLVERALQSTKVMDWQNAENALAKIEALTGRPAGVISGFEEPAPLPKRPRQRVQKPQVEAPAEPVVQTQREVPDWAKDVANNHGGDVAYADDNHALIRGFNVFGRSVYMPVDRALDLIGRTDIRSSKVNWLSPEKKAEFSQRAEEAQKANLQALEKNPDGPFKNATEKVIGTPSADPNLVSYIGGLLRQLGIDARVLVVHPGDVRGSAGDELGLHGAYESARTAGINNDLGNFRKFGPNGNDFYIHIDPNLDPTLKLEAAAHEVGHIVFETELQNAPKETKAAIEQAYQKWFKENQNVSAQDLIRATRNRTMAQQGIDALGAEGTIEQKQRTYLLKKSEWFADNVSRWATTDEKPRTLVEKFFSAVAQKLKDFMTAVTGNKFMPDESVKNFLDHLAAAPTDLQRLSDIGGERIPTTTDTGPKTVPEVGHAAESAISNLGKLQDGINEVVRASSGVVPTWLRKKALIAETLDGMVRIAGDNLKTSRSWADTHTQRQVISDVKNKADAKSAIAAMSVKPDVGELVDRHLAMLQNPTGLDSRRSWAEHTDLHDLPNADVLKQRHQEMVNDLNRLRQKGGKEALDSTLKMMQTKEYQSLAAALHAVGESWTERGVQFEGHGVNPDKTYQFMSTAHDDPAATNTFYRSAVTSLRDGIQKYVDDQKAAAAQFLNSDPKLYAKMTDPLDELTGFLRGVDSRIVQADRGNYSPLSHGKGDYFVSARLPVGEDKLPTPEATQALQTALDKAGFEIGVFHDTASSTIMSRVENQARMNRLASVFQELEKDGHLGEIKFGHPDNLNTMADLGPKYMQAMVEAIKTAMKGSENIDPEVANRVQAQMVARWMDMLPDHSVLKYLQPRKFVSGFDKNMRLAAIDAAKNISRASSGVSMQGQFAKVREAMRQEVLEQKASDAGSAQHLIGNDVANELWLRESQAAWHMPSSPFDTAQALMHTLRIGFNPPYMLTMLSQIPTLLHPELAKKYGFARSAAAIGGSMGRTFNIIRAVLASPDWATGGFREEALKKAGIPDKDIQTLMRLDNAGGLSNNTYTNAMTDLGEGANPNRVKYKNWMNAMGLLSEMLPRITAALSAGDLYDKRPLTEMSRDDYVHNVVTGSQYNWGPGQSSRLTGKGGPLGQFSRISLAFMQFQTKMIEKLYTEAHDLFSSGSSPQLRKEAGTFLAGHLVAMTAIAGTLGLPAASFLAGAVDKLAGALTGRDDIDTVGLYRTWMSNVLGPDVADVIAKGLPRALGMDLSHLGDQNLLPGTSIMVDKRKFEDAEKDWFKSMAGSAVGEIGDLYLGLRDMLNGDYLRGAIKVMPEGVKGLAEAYWLSKYGYVDKNGNAYPIQPGARDKLMAAIGIDPANLAQYEEADRIKTGLMAQRQYREQNISSHLVKGLMVPGSADVGYWMNEALQYEIQHPGMGGPLTSLQGDISKFVTKAGTAGAFTTPLGVKPLDFGLRQTAGFITPQRSQ